jgi:hypothetical protein
MTDLLQSASTWISGQLKEHVSQTVTFRRGTQTVSVQATIGNTLFESHGELGPSVQIKTRDYLIETDDLVLGGVAVLPQRDDIIVDASGDEYTILPTDDGVYWRDSDPYRVRIRVHTKQVRIG